MTITSRVSSVLLLLAAACNGGNATSSAADAASSVEADEIAGSALGGPLGTELRTFACANTSESCSTAIDYCYAGAETGFYQGTGTVKVGCNQLPAACESNPSCGCMFAFYPEGFCTCTAGVGVTLACSFI